jgi:hypothetical protein
VQAGILNPDDDQVRSVELAILGDPMLSERQKQALLEVYESFRAVTERAQPHTPDAPAGDPGQATSTEGS